MAKKLTTIAVENLKPRAARYEVPDRGCAGLYVVVQPTGKKSFALRYRRPQDQRPAKLTLGNGSMSLADARAAATAALKLLGKGTDPGAVKLDEAKRAALAKSDTVLAIGEKYLAHVDKRLRTADQLRATFSRLIYPELGPRPIAEVRRSDIVKLMDKVEEERGARMADGVLGALRAMCNWYAARHDTYNSPIVRGMTRTTPEGRRRDRVLSDDELRRVWHAAQSAGAFGALVRFLLLSGARRNEAARMRWAELAGTDWMLPAARNKTKVDLLRPLAPAAMQILDTLPRAGEHVFTVNGRLLTNFDRPKNALDAASGVYGWRLHDTRRVARSLMSRARVPNDAAEAVLGHVLTGIRKTYDVHDFYAEKKHALATLATLIDGIVEPQDNVTALRG
jgi:integrase